MPIMRSGSSQSGGIGAKGRGRDDGVGGCAKREQRREDACRNAARVAQQQRRDQYQQNHRSAAQRGLDQGHDRLPEIAPEVSGGI